MEEKKQLVEENVEDVDGDSRGGGGGDDGDSDDWPDDIMYTDDATQIYHARRMELRTPLSQLQIPETVHVLQTKDNCTVYLVGTAHFSEISQKEVALMLQQTQPDFVVVELCSKRISILNLDEETLLREAKDINIHKIRTAIKQSGLLQGVLHILLISMTAHITKQLGMAPGGEFRMAFNEAKKIPGCRIHLGDRPIGVTLRRALGSLSWFQKLRLAWCLLTSNESISKEDVEKCKQKDLLEEMLREMTGEFPAMSYVFLNERDMYLTHSLRQAARRIYNPQIRAGLERRRSLQDLSASSQDSVPSVVVGVVGIGHVPGIIANWEKEFDISSLLVMPTPSRTSVWTKRTITVGLAGVLITGCYQMFKFIARACSSSSNALPAVVLA